MERRLSGPGCGVRVGFWYRCVSTGSRRGPERDVDQLREAERRSVARELLDRCKRMVVVKVGRVVAAEQSGENVGNDLASHGAELDGDVIRWNSGVGVLPGHGLCLGQDVRPEGSLAGETTGDVRDGLLVRVGGSPSDQQFLVGDRVLAKSP